VQLPKDAYAIVDLQGIGDRVYKLRLTQGGDMNDAYYAIYAKAVSVQIFFWW
jgi:hypothetical protein